MQWLETSFQKLQPKRVKYQNYKVFLNKIYRVDLISKLSYKNLNLDTLDKFLGICIDFIKQNALCKTKMLRGNQCRFLNKELPKAIMTRTR